MTTIDPFTVGEDPQARIADLPPDPFLDPWRVPVTQRGRSFVTHCRKQAEHYEGALGLRKRARKAKDQATFEAALTAIITDLAHAHITRQTGPLAVSRSNRVLGRRTRYSDPLATKQLRDILDLLAKPEVSLISMEIGFQNPFARRNQLTVLQPGPVLKGFIRDHELTLEDLGRNPHRELIILKSGKGGFWDTSEYVDYPDTPETIRMRTEVEEINGWLAQAELDFILATEKVVDTKDRQLRRIFTKGRFDHGGRLFGGFWQPLSKKARLEGLMIGDEQVAELDYGQMNPLILYGLAGQDPPPGDLYHIPSLCDVRSKDCYRAGVKKLLNSLLFAHEPLKKKPKGSANLLPQKLRVDEIIERLYEVHPVLKTFEAKEIGYYLQFLESEILIKVLRRMREETIVALPIHDAVMVPHSLAERAKEIMLSVFKEVAGVDGKVTVEGHVHQ